MSVNKVILIGNVGTDPEVKHLESGNSVANFPLATSESYKNKDTGERVTQTEWHNIVIWGGIAKVVEQYVKKGDKIYLEGKNKTEKWTDKDGNDRYTTKVICNQMTMLGSPKNSESQTQSNSSDPFDGGQDDGNDDLPF